MWESIKAKIKKLYNEYYSLIFIPDNGKSNFEFKLRKIYIYTFLVLFIFASIYSFVMTDITSSLYSKLTTKTVSAQSLEKSMKKQKDYISELEHEFEQIDQKIISLNELESNIRTIVGIHNQTDEVVVNRSSFEMRQAFKDQSIDALHNSQSFNIEAQSINIQLDSKIQEMNTLIDEVEARLKYLECYPDKWPTYGRISSKYGNRIHPISKRKEFHSGIDIANSYGTTICASGSGKVIFSGYKNGYGKTIIINHGYGYKTLYGHNSKLLVDKGDYVKKGQPIAKMGSTGTSTGNHCHFEVIQNGSTINPYKTLQ